MAKFVAIAGSWRAFQALVISCLLAACSSGPPQPNVDYKQDYNFVGVKKIGMYRNSGQVSGDNPLQLSDIQRERIDTALAYAAVGASAAGLRAWRHQGGRWKSRNAGVVMASGAAALGLRLGGPASYEGRVRERPLLGEGRSPEPSDVSRALALLDRALVLWLAVILIGAWMLA